MLQNGLNLLKHCEAMNCDARTTSRKVEEAQGKDANILKDLHQNTVCLDESTCRIFDRFFEDVGKHVEEVLDVEARKLQ